MVELNGTKADLLFLLVLALAEICQKTPVLFFDRTAVRSPSLTSCRFIYIRPQSGQQSTTQTKKRIKRLLSRPSNTR